MANQNCPFWFSSATMNNLPDDILRIILNDNEHAMCCNWRYYRIITDDMQIIRWLRTILYENIDTIRRLSYANIYHHVYKECILKRRRVVNMSINIAMCEFNRYRAVKTIDKSETSLPLYKRLQMVVDILMYWNNTRHINTPCVCHRVKVMTGIRLKGCSKRCHSQFEMKLT